MDTFHSHRFLFIAVIIVLCSIIFLNQSSFQLLDKRHKRNAPKYPPSIFNLKNNLPVSNTTVIKHSFQNSTNFKITKRVIKLKSRPELGLNYYTGLDIFNPHRKYAVIIVNRPYPTVTIAYQINVPVSCQTWISIGYGCFVAVVNNPLSETNQTERIR